MIKRGAVDPALLRNVCFLTRNEGRVLFHSIGYAVTKCVWITDEKEGIG